MARSAYLPVCGATNHSRQSREPPGRQGRQGILGVAPSLIPKKTSDPGGCWRPGGSLLIRVAGMRGALDDAELLAGCPEGFEAAVEVLFGVCRHVASAKHGLLGRHTGGDEGIGIN